MHKEKINRGERTAEATKENNGVYQSKAKYFHVILFIMNGTIGPRFVLRTKRRAITAEGS